MTTCESRSDTPTIRNAETATLIIRKPGTVTPITRAITPLKLQGTVRAVATAPPIEGLAEGNLEETVMNTGYHRAYRSVE